MTSCIVLGDAAVHRVLLELSKHEILEFLSHVANALRDFSVGNERLHQPEPSVIKRDDGRKTLFRPFTSSTGVGVKIIVDPSAALGSDRQLSTEATRRERNKLIGLHGVLTICNENGFPTGFINAEEVTGYRTSLSALILYVRRSKTSNIVVFGAGKQALWHIRLALALRGEEIKRITVINRTVERSQDMLQMLQEENEKRWQANVQWNHILSNNVTELKSLLGEADVVFCTTPSTKPLFPAEYLTDRDTGCYVSTIGSWSADMLELDPELLKHAARERGKNGIVVVDDKQECMKSAGEVVRSGLEGSQMIELGELVSLVVEAADKEEKQTKLCLEEGFVVYKSVGVSVTDLAAGQALLGLAKTRGLGLSVADF